jgi:hypothetical protein
MEYNPVVGKVHIYMLSKILDDVGFKMKGTTQEEIGLDMISSIVTGLWRAEKSVDDLICDVYSIADIKSLTLKEYIKSITAIIKNPDFLEAWEELTGGLN